MGVEAQDLGLSISPFGGSPVEFVDITRRRAAELAMSRLCRPVAGETSASRRREAQQPLAGYRERELERMR